MPHAPIRFDDGALYEHLMGRWSALVAPRFLSWIAVPPASRWLDVGCGNGAFTEQLFSIAAAAEVVASDPSPGQLAHARQRLPAGTRVTWLEGDAQNLAVPDAGFDAAVMALVLFFVPDPARGVAEMARAVRSGGTVAAYHWDMLGGGFPLAAIGSEMLKIGLRPALPPSAQASTLEASRQLWEAAGLRDVETCAFTVERRFESFEDYWCSAESSNHLKPMFDALPPEGLAELMARVRRRLDAAHGAEGPLTVSARANAVCGLKP